MEIEYPVYKGQKLWWWGTGDGDDVNNANIWMVRKRWWWWCKWYERMDGGARGMMMVGWCKKAWMVGYRWWWWLDGMNARVVGHRWWWKSIDWWRFGQKSLIKVWWRPCQDWVRASINEFIKLTSLPLLQVLFNSSWNCDRADASKITVSSDLRIVQTILYRHPVPKKPISCWLFKNPWCQWGSYIRQQS